MRRSWQHVVPAVTVHNGVDTDRWRLGAGGEGAIWSGRIVPEKAPHAAIDAARRAGIRLRLCGPVYDEQYFRREIRPRLGGDVELVGHLTQAELCEAVGRADVALVTPAWEEPYGLVAVEAMACGTPVAGFARGAMAELVDEDSGRLVDPDDLDALASAIGEAARLPRARVRAAAVERWGLARMVDEYEALYRSMSLQGAAA
jgi:glycosyltransferase involved in cell wall biosynthesis